MAQRWLSKPSDPWAVVQLIVGAIVVLGVVVASPTEGDPTPFLPQADRIYSGEVPYRDFLVEYPPLALPSLVLPRLLLGAGSTPGGYQTVFSLFSLALALGTGLAVAWLVRRGWSARSLPDSMLAFAGLALALGPVIVWRYDILPTFLATLALVAVALNRPPWAGALLGFGTAAKLFPAFLIPPLVVFYLTRRRRWATTAGLVLGFAAAFGAIIGVAYLIAGPNVLEFLSYQDDRGVEVESIMGGVVLLADIVANTGADVSVGFGSWQVASPLIRTFELPRQAIEAAMLFGLVGGASVAMARDLRAADRVSARTLVTYAAATILLVMLANKVLSPQYLVWLLPFGALLPRWQSMWMLGTCVLTTLIYPLNFSSLVGLDPLMIAILNVRNVMLVALFVWLVLPGSSESGHIAHAAQQAGDDADHQDADRKGPAVSRDEEHHQHREDDGKHLG